MSTIITKNSSTASAVPSAGDLVKGELAVNVTDKKVYTKDNSAAIVKVVGSLGNQEANAVAITGGTVSGITDLAVADGGTGASSAADARTNLGVTATGADTAYAFRSNNLSDLASVSTARTNLGLGTIATQAASNVTITGGSVTGITDLAVADGGTGASTAANARTNLGAAASGANSDITALSGLTTALSVAQGGTGVGTSTGTGSVVLSNSPTLVTPALGTPASATLTNATGLPVATGVSGLGTGVATALAVNVGSAGAPLVNGGVLGTPSSGTATNLTGLPISTGVSGLGTGVATFLGTPSSANLASAVTDETGTGALVFANSPTLVTPALGTPSSGTATNLTGLPLSTGVTGTLPIANGGTGQTTATAAFNALAPSQATNSGKYLTTDGTNTSWATVSGGGSGTVTSVNVSGGTTGLTTSGGPVTTSGTITLAGTLAVANGGTGATSFASAGLATLTGTETLTNKTIEFVDGTASAPSITNVGDTNTGIFFPAADTIGFAEGGAEVARITNTGAWSFGATGTATGTNGQVLTSAGSGSAPTWTTVSGSSQWTTSGSDIYYNTGFVGIGSSAPTSTLTLARSNNFPFVHINNAANTTIGYLGWHGGTGGNDDVRLGTVSTKPVTFFTNDTERARITSDGQLLVRTTTAVAGENFTVFGAAGIAQGSDTNSYFAMRGSNSYFGSAGPLIISTNSAERARITSDGNLLVGDTSAPGVAGARLYSAARQASVNSDTLSDQAASNMAFNTASGSNNSGATTCYLARYATAGAISPGALFKGYQDSTIVIKINNNGNVTNLNNSYGSLSDARLKENVTDATPKLENLNKLRVVNFNLKNDPKQLKQIGLIAQEVEQVFPGLVETAADEEGTKAVKYSVLVPMLLKAIQEQQAMIEQLKADVAALKGQA